MTLSTSHQPSPDQRPDRSPAQWTTSPIIDYEPVPEPLGQTSSARGPTCPTPSPETLHRRSPRRPRAHRPPLNLCDPLPPRSAVVFAETTLRQVIEVIDRRRPVAQLRQLLTPVLVDRVIAHAGATRSGSATIRRVRVRPVDPGVGAGADARGGPGDVRAAEVVASFTRSGRVHAVAARIERYRDHWRMVALQIG